MEGMSTTQDGKIVFEEKKRNLEYNRLRTLIPQLAEKQTVSKVFTAINLVIIPYLIPSMPFRNPFAIIISMLFCEIFFTWDYLSSNELMRIILPQFLRSKYTTVYIHIYVLIRNVASISHHKNHPYSIGRYQMAPALTPWMY